MSLTKLSTGLIKPGSIKTADLNVSVSANISSAFDLANTANLTATSASVYANASFSAVNTATTNAATADQRAVTSGSYANSAYGAANTADQRAVTSGSYANSAYGAANTADQSAVTSGVYANSAYSTANNKLNSTGGTVSGDLNITGNLTVLGNATTISVSNIKLDDPLIQLAANNETSDALDIGFLGHYSDDSGTNQRHTGLFRDATDGKYYLFYNYLDPSFDTGSPNNVIDIANSSFRIANLTANIITDTITVRGYDPLNHTNNSYGQANTATTNAATADQRAVTSGTYANAAYGAANTSDQRAVTSGSYANSAYSQANTASQFHPFVLSGM